MKSYPTKFKSFQRRIVQMEALQELKNSIQTLIILWPVYPIQTNSLFWVIFEELPFCHFPPLNTFIRGIDLSFEYLSFSNKRYTTILFPSPLTFLQWPIDLMMKAIDQRFDQPSFDTYVKMESLLIKTLNSQDKADELKFMEKLYKDDVNISVLTAPMEFFKCC